MIIANIVGGLGNQMFQYACARALALEVGVPLKVTLDMFPAYASYHNGYELDRVFNLELEQATSKELANIIGRFRTPIKIRKALMSKKLAYFRGKYFILDENSDFSDGNGVLKKVHTAKSVYLQGYWQSERYFAKYDDILRKDFTFKTNKNDIIRPLVEDISESNAVSLHIRRGDYVNNIKTFATHGICPMEYYSEAIAFLQKQVPNMRLFVFSDDAEWVKENLMVNYPSMVLINGNYGENSYIDMQLMSLCTHNIIANSSFSWWGAWLNPNPNKIVIAPKKWFANGKNSENLFPSSWMQL